MPLIDRFDDNNAYRRKLEQEVGEKFALPARYAVVREDDFALVEKTASGHRYKLPLHTADETLCSLAYFMEYGSQLEPQLQKTAAARLHAALSAFGLPVHEELEKVAAYDIGYSDAEGRDLDAEEDAELRRLFGVGVASDVEELEGHFNDVSPRGKRRLSFLAKEAGLKLRGSDAYMGEDTWGTNLGAAMHIRGMYLDDRRGCLHLGQQLAALHPAYAVEKLAAFDHANGLERLYITHDVPDPYVSVYGSDLEDHSFEKLSAYESVQLGSHELSPEVFGEFISTQHASLSDTFGAETADALQRNPVEVYESLPLPLRQAIAGMYRP